jgi:lipoprotein-anchoring transpeptidase ErfK/SrfK
MADYYPLLRKAIDRLDRPTEAARYNVYERARQALVRQLRAAGIVDAQLDQHLEALDQAVEQIEGEVAGGRGARTRVLRAVPEEPRLAPESQEPQAAPAQSEPPRAPDPAGENDSASVLRRWAVAMGAAVLLVALAAGLSFYYFKPGSRPAAADRPADRLPAVRPASAPTAVAAKEDAAQPSYILRRQRVFYRTTHPPNTIAVSLSQKFLYVVQPNQVAIRYTIGVGSACDKLAGLFHVTEKVPRPADTATGRAPVASVMPAQNFSPPALYFDSGRAVHEASDPKAVGQLVRTGCFLTWEQDIADLFERVSLNDRVVVVN